MINILYYTIVVPWSKLRLLTQRPFYLLILWWLDMMRILMLDQSWNFSPMWYDYFTILSVVWLKIIGFDCLQNWVSTYAPMADLMKVNTNAARKYHISWPNQAHNNYCGIIEIWCEMWLCELKPLKMLTHGEWLPLKGLRVNN